MSPYPEGEAGTEQVNEIQTRGGVGSDLLLWLTVIITITSVCICMCVFTHTEWVNDGMNLPAHMVWKEVHMQQTFIQAFIYSFSLSPNHPPIPPCVSEGQSAMLFQDRDPPSLHCTALLCHHTPSEKIGLMEYRTLGALVKKAQGCKPKHEVDTCHCVCRTFHLLQMDGWMNCCLYVWHSLSPPHFS